MSRCNDLNRDGNVAKFVKYLLIPFHSFKKIKKGSNLKFLLHVQIIFKLSSLQ